MALQFFFTNNVFMTKDVKPQEQQNKKANIQILARAGNRTRDLSHRNLSVYVRSLRQLDVAFELNW